MFDFRACRVLCGFVGGLEGAETVLVWGPVLEALTPPREQYGFLDNADPLSFADLPRHDHAAGAPVADGSG
jgi:hypothetical protein